MVLIEAWKSLGKSAVESMCQGKAMIGRIASTAKALLQKVKLGYMQGLYDCCSCPNLCLLLFQVYYYMRASSFLLLYPMRGLPFPLEMPPLILGSHLRGENLLIQWPLLEELLPSLLACLCI